MQNVLVCDDDKDIVDAIAIYLEKEGLNVFKAYNGIEALEITEKEDIQVAVIDIMMPVMDGIQCTMKIREHSSIPIIILSAKSEDSDKILGLNIGADDYVTKPFNPLELVARVKSNLRRYTQLGNVEAAQKEEDGILRVGELVLNENSRVVTVDGDDVKLTKIEYNILRFLMQNKGKVFSIGQIYENIWNGNAIAVDNTVAVHIRHIREKIEIDPKNPKYLKVVWGVGYKIDTED